MIKNTELKLRLITLGIFYLICIANIVSIFLIHNFRTIKNVEYEDKLNSSWPQYPGEFLVDVEYTFWFDLRGIPGFISYSYCDFTVSLGTESHNYFESPPTIMQGSNTFTLGSNTMEADMSFELDTCALSPGYPMPIVTFLSFDEILRPSLYPLFESENFPGFFPGTIGASIHSYAKVNSITFSEDYVQGNNPYEVFVNLIHNNASDITAVILQKRISSTNSWQNVTTWNDIDFLGSNTKTLTYLEDGNSNPTGDNQEVFYRVLMRGTHFHYRSQENYRIMVNPLKLFISEFSVILENEFYDLGVINPTEIFSIRGNITNPTASAITHNVYIQCNRYFSGSWENEIDTINIGTIPANSKMEFSFRVPDLNNITPLDSPYMIPGWDYYRENKPDIHLTPWIWCNPATGEVYSTSREITFDVWILEDPDDSKLTLGLPVYIPDIKLIYTKAIRDSLSLIASYEEGKEIANAIGNGLFFASPVVAIAGKLIPGFPSFTIGLGIFYIGLNMKGLTLTADLSISQELKNIEENIANIIRDPPDPNIYEVVEIEYEPIEPLDDELAEMEHIRNLYNLAITQNRLEDVTRAIRITNERYMYAIMNGEFEAAVLQATALKEYTILQTNYYNSYLRNLENSLDCFTPERIINSKGFDFNEFAVNISILIDYFLNNAEDPEVRQLLYDEGYSDDDINELVIQLSEFDINVLNQEMDTIIDEFNAKAHIITEETTELIDGLITGTDELVITAHNPDIRSEFSISSTQHRNIMEIDVSPSIQEGVNGEDVIYLLQIENLLTEVMTYNIEITNFGGLDASHFSYDPTVLINPLDTYRDNILVSLPIDIEPMIVNLEVQIDTILNGEMYAKTKSLVLIVKDDDISPPELYNLEITDNYENIFVSFIAKDKSGIEVFQILVDNIVIEPISYRETGELHSFTLLNQWNLRKGLHEVEVRVTDGDNDRPNDCLMNSIFGNFEISLGDMYEYVDWQLEELKTYIKENLFGKNNQHLIWKLSNAQKYLAEAFFLANNDDITCALYHDKIAKIFIQITEFKTEIYNRHCWISDEHTEYIINSLHTIRNNIVILMGASIGSELAYNIAYLEVDLLNLNDYIEKELPYCVGKYLGRKIWYASKLLEIAFFRIAEDEEINCLLSCTQWKLERTIHKINCFLERGKISEAQANYLKVKMLEIIEKIDSLKT